MVPAFVGLGAPHWDPDARGAIFGLTLDATAAHLARAALEAVAYQTLDLIEAMAGDGAGRAGAMRVDGGMAANDWLCQFLADMLERAGRAAAESGDDGARRGVPGGHWRPASGPASTRSSARGRAVTASNRACLNSTAPG